MHVLHARNVNGLLPRGIDLLLSHGSKELTRAGEALVIPWPVVSVYECPVERVLFSARRDANPFFHLYEALWMLAGRYDAESLDHYVADFGERYAEPNGIIHGAYGYRWRNSMGFDQLNTVVEKLRLNPNDRQCVIQMWDATTFQTRTRGYVDVGQRDNDPHWRDRPCNTHVYLRVREEPNITTTKKLTEQEKRDRWSPPMKYVSHVLDLTVCCRSNDIIWGAYGANAVHFSLLQEYLAGRIGVGIGKMYQFSNNYHAYTDALNKFVPIPRLSAKFGDGTIELELARERDPYDSDEVRSVSAEPVGYMWDKWDQDLWSFQAWHDRLWKTSVPNDDPPDYYNTWFKHTATGVCVANWFRRHQFLDAALETARRIGSSDWRRACVEWIQRRMER